jgi:hypothetical protein
MYRNVAAGRDPAVHGTWGRRRMEPVLEELGGFLGDPQKWSNDLGKMEELGGSWKN